MKANEIQISDWLYSIINRFDHTEKKLCKVTGIRTDSDVPIIQCDDTDVWYPLDSYEPIPITPEILEKNGFVPKFSDGCLTEYLIYKDIVEGLHEMYIEIYYFNSGEKEHKLECFDCRTGGCQIWIKYVHQIQHALRLCGIEKTIEL